MREKIEDFLDEAKDFLDQIKLPALGGVIGSFIGMAIAKLIGIL